MKQILCILTLLSLPSLAWGQNPFGDRGLFIKQGDISVSGMVSGEYVSVSPKVGDTSNGFLFTLAPSVGYYINENVAISASLTAIFPQGDLFEGMSPSYIFSAGAVYYHRINNFYVYIGLMGGYIKPAKTTPTATNNTKNYKNLDGWYKTTINESNQSAIIFPAGVLFPITTSVAFDVGLRGIYIIDDDDNAILDVALGWFGLQAFF